MLNTPTMEIIQLLTQLKNAKSVWEKNKKKPKKVTKIFFFAKSFESMLEAVQNPVKNVRGSQF